MPRRSALNSAIEEVLSELESEFEEPKSTEKFLYTWVVLVRRDFGGPEEVDKSLSVSKPESYTREGAKVRHSAVVQMAYKKLKAAGLVTGTMKVYRYRDYSREACSMVDLGGKYLEILDCLGFLPE